MAEEIVHISFRSDPETLDEIEADLANAPTEDLGFPFRIDYGEYEINENEKQKTLIVELVNEVTNEQAYEMISEFINPNQYKFVKIVFFCLGKTSGDIVNFS